MGDYRTEQLVLAERVRTRRLKPARPAVPSQGAGDKRSFALSLVAVLLLTLIWVWSNLPVQGPLDHAAPGEMDAGSPARYAVEIVVFLIGWSAVAAAIFIPASLARRNALDIRREFIFAGYCFIAWLLFGAVSLCGDLLLHMVVRAQSWLAANTWLLTAAPLGAAGTFELTEFKRKMLYAWSAGRTNADLPATAQALRSGYGGVGPFGPILLVIFALGESSLAWAIALGAVIVTQTRFPAMRPLQVLVGLSLLIAAAIATLSGASVVCAHDGVACGAG